MSSYAIELDKRFNSALGRDLEALSNKVEEEHDPFPGESAVPVAGLTIKPQG